MKLAHSREDDLDTKLDDAYFVFRMSSQHVV